MQIEVTDNTAARRYEAAADGRLAGFIDYRVRDGRTSLIHTQVEDDFEGKGVASTLVKRALGMVRDSGLELLPLCPFVQAYMQRHPEFLELVPVEERRRFGLSETAGRG